MSQHARFESPADSLALKCLLGGPRAARWITFVAALAFHVGLSQLAGQSDAGKPSRPLTTQFFKRQPRLTKPLELKRLPRPKRRRLHREMLALKARRSRQQPTSWDRSIEAARSLVRPQVAMGRAVSFGQQGLEPAALAGEVVGSKEAKEMVDMSLDMVDVEALDTGQYQAMVIQDPGDKRNIRGYLHLAVASPFSVRLLPEYKIEQRIMNGVRRLILRLNEWTDIEASLAKQVTFDSVEFFETPWVYLHVFHSMDPTQGEVDNLGEYLLNGGLFFFEGRNWSSYRSEQHLMRFVKSALECQKYRQGVDWEYQFLPNSHPIFYCYYDFPDGPPIGPEVVWSGLGWSRRDDGVEPWCRAIELGGRVVVLNTNQVYVIAWSDWGNPTVVTGYQKYDPAIQFRFGINTIIFALTQEGSITHRVMDTFRR